VRAGGQELALPVAALSGVERGLPVVALPGAPADLAGIAGVHGQLVPVFVLAALVGAKPGEGRFLAVCAVTPPLALAFDELAGLVEVPLESLEPAGPAAPRHARATLRAEDRVYWVVDVPVLLEGAKP
jgi:chemotaxis signal transduction protein